MTTHYPQENIQTKPVILACYSLFTLHPAWKPCSFPQMCPALFLIALKQIIKVTSLSFLEYALHSELESLICNLSHPESSQGRNHLKPCPRMGHRVSETLPIMRLVEWTFPCPFKLNSTFQSILIASEK